MGSALDEPIDARRRGDATIHHHYVVVDRGGGNIGDYTSRGAAAFVADHWQAVAFHDTTHHDEHGVYRNPDEHAYTRNDKGKCRFESEYAWP